MIIDLRELRDAPSGHSGGLPDARHCGVGRNRCRADLWIPAFAGMTGLKTLKVCFCGLRRHDGFENFKSLLLWPSPALTSCFFSRSESYYRFVVEIVCSRVSNNIYNAFWITSTMCSEVNPACCRRSSGAPWLKNSSGKPIFLTAIVNP